MWFSVERKANNAEIGELLENGSSHIGYKKDGIRWFGHLEQQDDTC